MNRVIVLCLFALLFVGCTTIKVRPLPGNLEIKEISVIDNPKVIVRDFVPVMERQFARHGITLKRVPADTKLGENEYGIRYSARRTWDIVPYLADANVDIYKGNLLIAEGIYHLILGGGFSPSKFRRTETKLTPMYNELLKNYPLVPQ